MTGLVSRISGWEISSKKQKGGSSKQEAKRERVKKRILHGYATLAG
jgi:PIN domain nuclease of toxin-antitoxin system